MPRRCWARSSAAPPGVRWHFLGELQRNKLARLAPHVYLWHGLDSACGADALAKRSPGAAVLVEVRLAGGDHATVSLPDEVPALVGHAAAAGLEVRGLMAVASPRPRREEVRAQLPGGGGPGPAPSGSASCRWG